ncbi:hypothetical protein F5141DRAFT_1060273 [Pisolithus sp. B1]|nr:hypothetical protein F5141DRAFT_1060273 [Pisolithus sp. B1]
MFVKNSSAFQDAVAHILIIFKRLIINSGRLEEVAKLRQWRDAVRDIRGKLEAVRSIANRTDNIPHMLIGVDKYVHWMENIGTPGIPFPNWHQALFPPIESIAGHPWLLTVEWQYDVGLGLQMPASTTELAALTSSSTSTSNQAASRSSTMPRMTTTGLKGHIPTCSTRSAKGRAWKVRGKPPPKLPPKPPLKPPPKPPPATPPHLATEIPLVHASLHAKSPQQMWKIAQCTHPEKSHAYQRLAKLILHHHQYSHNELVQDNSMQTHQVDMDVTVTSSNVVKMQHKTV